MEVTIVQQIITILQFMLTYQIPILTLALVAIISAIVALRQYREIGNTRQAEVVLWIFGQLDQRREERRSIFNELDGFSEESFSSMPDALRKAADNAAASMDYVGLIVESRLVRKKLAFKPCLEVVINLWEVMEPYIMYRRKQRGRYWPCFEQLYKECKAYQQKHNIEVRRFKDVTRKS